jgi:hypothetical protein
MKNMGGILEAAGSGFDKVVKCTILLADMDDFATVNGVYGACCRLVTVSISVLSPASATQRNKFLCECKRAATSFSASGCCVKNNGPLINAGCYRSMRTRVIVYFNRRWLLPREPAGSLLLRCQAAPPRRAG